MHKQDQRGLVSIFVASILMIITSLIVIGFLYIVNREYRQSIDEQLSTQANIAAESGINAAVEYVEYQLENGIPLTEVNNCSDGVDEVTTTLSDTNQIDSEGLVEYTCLLLDPEPEDLLFTNSAIQQNNARVIPIRTSAPVGQLTFEWRSSSNIKDFSTSCGTSMEFQDILNWNKTPLLYVEIVPIPGGAFGRQDLVNSMYGSFYYPCNSGGSTTLASSQGDINFGNIQQARCTSDPDVTFNCSMSVNSVNSSNFYIRVKSVYGELDLRITATDNTALTNPIKFAGVQVVVDSTGRANDVFKRIRARVPVNPNYNQAEAAIQARNDVCKKLSVAITRVLNDCLP